MSNNNFQSSNFDQPKLKRFNTGIVALQGSFWEDSKGNTLASIRLSPAFEKAVDGRNYNYDKSVSIFFTISQEDTITITEGIKKILSGEAENFVIKHFGDKGKTALTIGNNLEGYEIYLRLTEYNEKSELEKELIFDFATQDKNKNGVLILNADLDTLEGEPAPINIDLKLFINFLKLAEKVISGEVSFSKNESTKQTTSKQEQSVVRPPLRERKTLANSSNKNPKPITSKDAVKALFGDD
jgi:hypothetical protein